MGKKYGGLVAEMIALLSSIWMIGVVASQVLGGASVLRTIGVNNQLSIIVMASAITLLSLINLRTLVIFFTVMLILSSLSLVLILSFFGFDWIPISFMQAIHDVKKLQFFDITGIVLPTVIVTFIGMDFHQFIVKARTKKDAYFGILSSGVFLILISLILLSLVNAAISQNLLFGLHDPRQTISIILNNFGGGFSPYVSYLLALPIVLVALGSGSGVNRIVNQSVTSTKFLPNFFIKKPNVFFAVFIAVLLISFSGDSIISLIVAFYAIYVGSIFIPFLAFLLDSRYKLRLKKSSIRLAIMYSVICMLFIFIYSYLPQSFVGNHKTSWMILCGFLVSTLVIFISNRTKFYTVLSRKLHFGRGQYSVKSKLRKAAVVKLRTI